MTVLILTETAQGYGLFKLKKDSLVQADPLDVAERFDSLKNAQKSISFQAFKRFRDVKEATQEIAELQEGRIGKVLKSFLKKQVVKGDFKDVQLAIWDKTLAAAVKQKFELSVLLSPSVHEIMRGIKTYMEDLVADLGNEESKVMSMSLSHSLNRFKLKFSPEKVDVMVIQAVGLLDDLDKELNNLGMRLKEWYGFHFPELLKIVADNGTFAKVVKLVGYRSNVKSITSFDGLVPEEVAAQIRQAAETSMGSELVDSDLENIEELADRVLELADYRASLTEYLRMRMTAIAPNLTYLVGEILGARLLAQAGSLMSLAKQASSTVQILGAEKALFRALKSKSNTPKYGLIYHAHLVGQASPKLKGKMARVLAAKIQLCSRYDAFKESGAGSEEGQAASHAIGLKKYVERRLQELTEGAMAGLSVSGRPGNVQPPKYTPSRMRNPNEV
eukprot:Gregarina_sp_Poly_1__10885@NODE_849_length_5977_cov_205_569882_g583_i1_p3_GENE_NODE_849_length_5977_cov_205_569882_g583_i1NODE_849_length_5977_cov_205_569882_g583_i1_p3_ORF_typecomplete_len446_score83_10Nop/PF01798_18/6_6e79NOP5NT/PF08156_13/1_1e13NOP5NT/PF08156_13/9_8e02_NODE_849_length_5977_cov_205_569882_g583_i145355872